MHLQFITHYNEKYTYCDSALLALKGGCRWIQLRMKDASDEEREDAALHIQSLCKKYDAVFIIDDHVELAKKIHADGVHLGKKDMPISEARKILGRSSIIGGTANTFEDVKAHYTDGAEYVGCGPFRFTTTKKGLSPVLGLEGYRNIITQMRDSHIDIPVYAIGGITYQDIPSLMSAGIDGIALSGAIINAANPIEETNKIIRYNGK